MSNPYEIATWRFEQIAPLIDPSLNRAQRRAALRERTARRVKWPTSSEDDLKKIMPIPRSTLSRWIKLYREHGYQGLLPKARKDRGKPREKSEALAEWIQYAIGMLYEQPDRSLTQLEKYLQLEFEDYSISRSTLWRRLREHPAYSGLEPLRKGTSKRLFDRYQASDPHECWQLDGKGPFPVRLTSGQRIRVHVLSVLDACTRMILAVCVAPSENEIDAARVIQLAAAKYGLADRFQFDRGSAFDSHLVRGGLAQCGIHRNHVEVRAAYFQGLIEAYHRALERWFVKELRAQQVVDLRHLEELLEAMIEELYNEHLHRELKTTPKKALAGRLSERRLSLEELARAFWVTSQAKSHAKTGEVKLGEALFRVPARYAGRRCTFRYDKVHEPEAVLVLADREIALEPFFKKPLPPVRPSEQERRGTGQLQKLLDKRRGHTRPNAQPGFGLPEVFAELSSWIGREVPADNQEAHKVLAFYREHGPLARDPFREACRKSAKALGAGRPLSAYLADLERQITPPSSDSAQATVEEP